MKTLQKKFLLAATGMMVAGVVQAGDMNSVVAYSLGEFDRVGINQPTPKIQKSDGTKAQKTSVAGAAQTHNERQLAAHKAEFLRRMFWLALVAR